MKTSRDRDNKEDKAGESPRPEVSGNWVAELLERNRRGRQECRVLIERSERLLREILDDIRPNGSIQ